MLFSLSFQNIPGNFLQRARCRRTWPFNLLLSKMFAYNFFFKSVWETPSMQFDVSSTSSINLQNQERIEPFFFEILYENRLLCTKTDVLWPKFKQIKVRGTVNERWNHNVKINHAEIWTFPCTFCENVNIFSWYDLCDYVEIR